MPSRFSRYENPPPFAVEVEPDREAVTIRLVGELDIATRRDVERVVGDLRQAGFVAFRLDLRGVSFIDSCGMGLVLQMVRDQELAATVLSGSRCVRRAFEIAGLAEVIPIETARVVQRIAA